MSQINPVYAFPSHVASSTKRQNILLGLLHVTGQRIKVLYTNLVNTSGVAQLSVMKVRDGRPENLCSIPDLGIDLSLRLYVRTCSEAVFSELKRPEHEAGHPTSV
jgi:hypothetical protein